MNTFFKDATRTAFAVAALAGASSAAEILVSSDITVSTTWTSDNTYNLQKQIYVRPGATLTIEAGTVVASTTNLGGSLAVTRGAQIHVLGTVDEPVIMTSKDDVATWIGGDPQFGVWREGANEWGNLTIMGAAYISENAVAGNVNTPNANNEGLMEGLVEQFAGDPDVRYGGGDDHDDSGSISFLSLRYGGKVISLNNELNGLSLGGIGDGTDISYVDVCNNVDDGIEIWGGCVNLKYLNIWNIGDDSLDIDQGYRGKIQNVCIVQGWSVDASQGSGVGDNAIEIDGAEDSDWQPVTTTTIYNATVIGQPKDGDGLTAWRDNARVQYRNSIFMDGGEKVVRFDNVDGDGANGYGWSGTLSWADSWTTSYSYSQANNANATNFCHYETQTSGNLCEMVDSVFYNNTDDVDSYDEAIARGVFAAANNNVMEPANSPIVSITRGPEVTKGGKKMYQVISLDPRAANDAAVEPELCWGDDFFCPQPYRGAFSPASNWLCGWTAASGFGFTGTFGGTVSTQTKRTHPSNVDTYWSGPMVVGNTWQARVNAGATGHQKAQILLEFAPANFPVSRGQVLVGGPGGFSTPIFNGPVASYDIPLPPDPSFVGFTLYTQAWVLGGPRYQLTQAWDVRVGDC